MIKFDPGFQAWVVRYLGEQFVFRLILALIVGFLIWVFSVTKLEPDVSAVPKAVVEFPNGQIELMEVADEPSEHAQGLSGRKTPQSMLFLFETKFPYSFWMPDMFFPIDIIWLDENRVIGFEKNVPPEEPAQTYYRPTAAISGVIEMPSGSVDDLALEVGDLLDIEWNAQ